MLNLPSGIISFYFRQQLIRFVFSVTKQQIFAPVGVKKVLKLKRKEKKESKPQATKINKEIEEGRKLEKMGKKFLLFV